MGRRQSAWQVCAYSNAYIHGHRYAYGDPNSDGYRYTHDYSYADPYSGADRHIYTNRHRDFHAPPYRYSDADFHVHSNGYTRADRYGYSHACPNGHAIADSYCGAHVNSGANSYAHSTNSDPGDNSRNGYTLGGCGIRWWMQFAWKSSYVGGGREYATPDGSTRCGWWLTVV